VGSLRAGLQGHQPRKRGARPYALRLSVASHSVGHGCGGGFSRGDATFCRGGWWGCGWWGHEEVLFLQGPR